MCKRDNFGWQNCMHWRNNIWKRCFSPTQNHTPPKIVMTGHTSCDDWPSGQTRLPLFNRPKLFRKTEHTIAIGYRRTFVHNVRYIRIQLRIASWGKLKVSEFIFSPNFSPILKVLESESVRISFFPNFSLILKVLEIESVRISFFPNFSLILKVLEIESVRIWKCQNSFLPNFCPILMFKNQKLSEFIFPPNFGPILEVSELEDVRISERHNFITTKCRKLKVSESPTTWKC